MTLQTAPFDVRHALCFSAKQEGAHRHMIARHHQPRQTVLVLTLDAARARLFWLEPSDRPAARLELHEDEQSFVNPSGRLRPGERYTDSFSGGVRSPSGQHLGFDDHQNQKDLEERKRFAHTVADAVERIVRARSVDRLIVAASHAEHALVVGELEHTRLRCELRHLPLEATTATPAELYEALHAHDLVR
jgi:hypothetical protein